MVEEILIRLDFVLEINNTQEEFINPATTTIIRTNFY